MAECAPANRAAASDRVALRVDVPAVPGADPVGTAEMPGFDVAGVACAW
jgi:hypothetical protein